MTTRDDICAMISVMCTTDPDAPASRIALLGLLEQFVLDHNRIADALEFVANEIRKDNP